MDLYVLDSDFNQITIIDDYESLIWSKRYHDFGDCELYVRACEEYVRDLQKGHYLIRSDDDMICRIKSIDLETNVEEGNFLVIVGADCRIVLSQRVVWNQTNYTGTVENYIRKLITDNLISPSDSARAIGNFVLGDSVGLTDTITEQVTYKPLDEKVIELCKAYDYGSKVTLNEYNQFVFSLYKGVDRSYQQEVNDHIVFSPEFDNIISSRFTSDDSTIKNVALIAGEGEGVDRKRLTYGTSSGLDRYELFVDAKDLSSQTEEGETIDYEAALKARGIEALAEYGTVISFEGEVEPNYSYKYGTDYNLGDIVQVMNEYGVEVSAKITEVIETFDSEGRSIIPTFQFQEVAIND